MHMNQGCRDFFKGHLVKPRLEPLPFLPPPEVGWMKILGLWDLRGSTFFGRFPLVWFKCRVSVRTVQVYRCGGKG